MKLKFSAYNLRNGIEKNVSGFRLPGISERRKDVGFKEVAGWLEACLLVTYAGEIRKRVASVNDIIITAKCSRERRLGNASTSLMAYMTRGPIDFLNLLKE